MRAHCCAPVYTVPGFSARKRMDSIETRKADVSIGAEIRSCFVFTVRDDGRANRSHRSFRDQFGMQIGSQIADEMRVEGFRTTKPTPGKNCDAGFRIQFEQFNVWVLLFIRRCEGAIEGTIITGCRALRSGLFRRHLLPKTAHNEWAQALTAIQKCLSDNPRVTSLFWLTSKQVNIYRGSRPLPESCSRQLISGGAYWVGPAKLGVGPALGHLHPRAPDQRAPQEAGFST